MGFRFQKRITLFPGVRINLSKSGASLSAGPRGASVTVGKRGVYGNVGIPGTGLSWRERLDKPAPRGPGPARQTRDAGPQMPERLMARMVGNEVHILDGDERPIDPLLVPAAKRLIKDDISRFLEEHASERNAAVDRLRELHHDVPDTVDPARATACGKPQRSQYGSQEEYMQALMSWRAEAANTGPDQDAIEDALLGRLGALEWPAETNIAIRLTGGRLLLDVDLPEIEDMPATRWSAQISKMELVEKPISTKDLAALYLDHVCAIISRLIGHSMAASHAIQSVAVSAYTQRKASSGRLDDEYVATVEVSRAQWNEIDKSDMAEIDPHNLLRRLAAKIETNARGVLLVQQPLS
jgi:hypothetical protein